MHDLRRQTLESGKTVSRKAQSRMALQASTKTNPHIESRVQIRHKSDGDERDSEGTSKGPTSISELLSMDSPLDTSEIWSQDIGYRIAEITDRKRSSVQGREIALAQYAHLLMSHYAVEEVQHKTNELLSAFVKSIKSESSEKEACNALSAIALTVITVPSEVIYDEIHHLLKRTYRSSGYHSVKALAILTLSIAAIFGGASESEIEEIMEEIMGIIESDGHSVDAADEARVVIAACQAWGYLATFLDDMTPKAESAIEIFAEQLESSDISVQTAAGENIALLYEKIFAERQSEENSVASDKEDEEVTESRTLKPKDIYHGDYQLRGKLQRLANESSKSVAKKNRKILHLIFSDILNTVEHPNRGPRYHNAIDNQSGKRYGSRMTVRINKMGSLRIDKWWKIHRLQSLKRVLGSGFVVHYQENEAVLDNLPMSGT